ncbi:MAG TPA: CocE/NonD family hydrolase [Actinopolymorphaceae bacterium]|nr:CocE/NonD family hydrolase [Actinopolymorphaceae bacterium]
MNTVSRVTCLDTAVTMPDGVALATDVTVADDGAQHPVLLIRTPYSRASVRGFHDAIGLARLGWAVVTQDVRGRWDSPGAFSPFRSERVDGATTVAWCAAQPWSNGGVAMAGASYMGFSQWLAAADRPAALRVIAPAIAGPTIRDAIYEGGALQLGVFSSWTLGIGALGSNLDADVVAAAIGDLDSWPDVLRDGTEKTALPRISPDWVRWLDPDDAELWSSLDAGAALLDGSSPRSQPAGYHLAGWHDLFCESTIRGYSLLTGPDVDDGVRSRQRLVVGPWAHLSMLRRTTGRLDFGTAAQGDFSGLFEDQFAFLTGGVAGQDMPSGVRVFVMGANRWLDLSGWPPPSTDTPLYLAGEGTLSWSPPAEAGSDRYHHDPADPVPTRGGRTLHPVPPDPGPLDQRAVEQRPDVLVYTSAPLDRDVTIIGTVRARLTFASTADRADVAVKLVDVHPDGRAMLVVDSIQRAATTPGTPQEVGVDVGSTALVFAAGHRIRIEIASSNYPRFDTCAAADQTVHHGGRALSHLTLPVHEGTV